MFKFLKKEPPRPAITSTHTTGISYYSDLISNLEGDHRQLKAIHERIKQEFLQQDLHAVSVNLKEFGTLLRNHLITENMRLYIYLQQKVAGDEINTQLVRDFRKEMDGIAKSALDFLTRYADIAAKPTNELSGFIAELDQIGGNVHERMHREEQTLYPLYAPNY